MTEVYSSNQVNFTVINQKLVECKTKLNATFLWNVSILQNRTDFIKVLPNNFQISPIAIRLITWEHSIIKTVFQHIFELNGTKEKAIPRHCSANIFYLGEVDMNFCTMIKSLVFHFILFYYFLSFELNLSLLWRSCRKKLIQFARWITWKLTK